MWKWTLRFSALPKRWISVTAPVWAVLGERLQALGAHRCDPPLMTRNSARVGLPVLGVAEFTQKRFLSNALGGGE